MSKSKKKNAVSFNKPPEPAFLRRIKEQIGYKESVTVDTKREELPTCEDDDLQDRDDEKPTVVQLKPGDLSQEEAYKLNAFEDEDSEPGKVKFRKPVKRSAEEMERDNALNQSSTKSNTTKLLPKKEESTSKKVKNKSLLSFDDEEDDDDGDE